ncbi:MAG: HEAT repeat domain-containing protein [Armatimonadota bacterium]
MIRDAALLTGCLVMLLSSITASAFAEDVAQRRRQVLDAADRGAEAVPVLTRALRDRSVMVRRAAIRSLAAIGAPAEEAVVDALDNSDPVVRRAALIALVGEPAREDLNHIETGLADDDPYVREVAVQLLLALDSADEEVLALLRQAAEDESPRVHAPAGRRLVALDPEMAPFEPEPVDRVLLRDRPEMADREEQITTAWQMRLPREGWKFRTDTLREGHRENWFEVDFDDSEWQDMEIETAWMAGYVGVGWYRLDLELPAEPEHIAAELHFEGVDESAWVWVNGTYVGGQDIGPGGWNRPFRVDVTGELRWGEVNQITVRAMNTAAAGGIWKPVTLEALALK